MEHRERVKLLYGRAAMGLAPGELLQAERRTYGDLVEALFASSKDVVPLETLQNTVSREEYQALSEAQQRALRRDQRNNTGSLIHAWCDRLGASEGSLREKMSLFWHGHFACRSKWGLSNQQLLNAVRQHALGNFGDLLRAVACSPAMIEFLDGQQNRKGAPNENFARELMELFTVGRGHYTEQDIKEAARAFTGRGFRLETAEYVFDEARHDAGAKTFRGRTGPWTGDDIIGFLMEDERTAVFVSRKIYRWFVNPQVDEAFVNAMANRFFTSGYDIADLMRFVFLSDHFSDPRNHGARIKGPVELLVGLERAFRITYTLPEQRLGLQRALGQVLFHPPNVAGWPEGRSWIDSNSMLLRLRVPSILLNHGTLDWEPDGSDPEGLDAAMMMSRSPGVHRDAGALGDRPQRDAKGRAFNTNSARDIYLSALPKDITNDELFSLLLSIPPSAALRASVAAPGQAALFDRVLQVLSSPEFQLC